MKKVLKKLVALIIVSILTLSVSADTFSPIYGVDVSVWQGNINWGKVAKTDKEFAIIRVGYNDKQDAQFENNYNNAVAAGIPVGCYMYSYAITENAAIEEAEIVMERIKGKKFEYPIYLDLEDAKLLNNGLTNKQRTDNALAFVRKMKENGYYVGVYANLNWFTNYLDMAAIQAECETWIAHYTEKEIDYSKSGHGMWQYSDSGRVDGISGNVDLNICYKDYPSIIKNGGYNGFEAAINSTVKGDINGDNLSNLNDVVLLAQYIAGWSNLKYDAKKLNVNGDTNGEIDLNDLVYLAQYVAGWEGLNPI